MNLFILLFPIHHHSHVKAFHRLWYSVYLYIYIHLRVLLGHRGYNPKQLTATQIAAYFTYVYFVGTKTYLIRCNLIWNDKDEEDCRCMYDDDCGLERSFGVHI